LTIGPLLAESEETIWIGYTVNIKLVVTRACT